MFIIQDNPKSPAAESYRTLRTNIEYSSFDEKIKSIVVTSSEPGEGKSTTAGNLALSLAEDNKKVVLIDCDLRKPSLHKKFKVSNGIGLSEVLIGDKGLGIALKEVGTNLSLLTSGKIPPNPSEMLGSKAMNELIKILKERFDYVVLDTPPVLAVTDAQILSTKVEGTILVVRADDTKRDTVMNAKKALEKVNANIIGTVLNGVEAKRTSYYYYYGTESEKSKKNRKKSKLKFRKVFG